jgi:drug/metabolite transporter (DMT)-like permease
MALVAALLTVYLAWGGTYPAIRVMVETVPPLLGTGFRFLAAGALLAAFLGVRGRLRAGRREIAGAALIGAVILGDIGLLAIAEQEVPAGLAALLLASVPLWIVIFGPLAGEIPTRRTVLAVLVGFAGVALLLSPGEGSGGAALGWLLLLVAAAAIEAVGQVGSRRVPLPSDALASTTMQLLAAGVLLVLAGAAAGEIDEVRPGAFSADSLVAFAYLVVPGSVLAYSAFVWLLANARLSIVSTYAYVNPVVAVVAGWALLGEEITAPMAAGGLAVLAAVGLVIRAGRADG